MFLMYFDPRKEFDLSSKEQIKDEKEDQISAQYVIILHNDPINGVGFVTKVIKEVFSYSARKALWLMLKAHFTGRSHLWIGVKNEALKKRYQMILYGADPNVSNKKALPLVVSVERYNK